LASAPTSRKRKRRCRMWSSSLTLPARAPTNRLRLMDWRRNLLGLGFDERFQRGRDLCRGKYDLTTVRESQQPKVGKDHHFVQLGPCPFPSEELRFQPNAVFQELNADSPVMRVQGQDCDHAGRVSARPAAIERSDDEKHDDAEQPARDPLENPARQAQPKDSASESQGTNKDLQVTPPAATEIPPHQCALHLGRQLTCQLVFD